MLWFIYSTTVYYLAALNLENVSKIKTYWNLLTETLTEGARSYDPTQESF
jgi:hypothetical protein